MQTILNKKPSEYLNHNKTGIHILGDFYGCKHGQKEMFNASLLEKICEEVILTAGLTQIGKIFFQFPNAGVTGVILLAESHLAIHTWPEKNYLTLDVFVCNVDCDNTKKARQVYQTLKDFFQPKKINHQEVSRE